MDQALRLGPLAISFHALLWIIAFWLALWISSRMAKRQKVNLGHSFSVVMLSGLLGARLGFVLSYPDHYLADPWSLINIRDGGWMAWAGFAVAGLVLAVMALRRSPKVHALTGAFLATLLVGWGATSLLDWQKVSADDLSRMVVTDLQGQPVYLDALGAQATVINLWASWCPPCVREMPALAQAQQNNPNIRFVFLNQGESASEVQAFLKAHNLVLDNVLLDTKSAASRLYSGGLLPTTLFLSTQAQLQDVRLGELSSATLQQRLEQLGAKSLR